VAETIGLIPAEFCNLSTLKGLIRLDYLDRSSHAIRQITSRKKILVSIWLRRV